MVYGGNYAQQFNESGAFLADEFPQSVDPVLEYRLIGMQPHRESMLVIIYEKSPFLKCKPKLLVFKDCPVLVPQYRKEDLVFHLLLDRLPFYVEEARVAGTRSVFKDVHPPPVLPACYAHVIGDNVQYLPHT